MTTRMRRGMNYVLSALVLSLLLAACGGGGGGGGGGESKEPEAVDWATADLRGNYRLNYTDDGGAAVDHRYVIHQTLGTRTTDGTEYYGGYDIDAPSSVMVSLAWWPSLASFVAVTYPPVSITPPGMPAGAYVASYVFNAGSDGRISGCFYHFNADTAAMSRCYSLNHESHMYAQGSWGRSVAEEAVSGLAPDPGAAAAAEEFVSALKSRQDGN